MSTKGRLEDLIALSRHLGEPQRDYVILAEGNTSAREDDETFWVKASGKTLEAADENSFVQVRFDGVLKMLDETSLTDAEVKARLVGARVDQASELVPSVETAVHAACLQVDGVAFVGHTHPTWVNMLLCAQRFEEAFAGRLFPDEIVVCGPTPLLLPYVDPGLPLARAIRRGLEARIAQHGEPPKLVYMQNHGLIALGATAKQVTDITAMAVKTARVIIGAHALGGPRFLPVDDVQRIHTRPDEHFRQRMLEQ